MASNHTESNGSSDIAGADGDLCTAPAHSNGRNGSTPSPMETETDDIKLYDITPMDYYSKTQTALSKSQIFRDELWRRRHTTKGGRQRGSGSGSSSASSTTSNDAVDIETVLTRNMGSDDLRRLIEHQMVEALKLTRLWTYRESDSNDEADAQLEEVESILSKSSASLDVSVVRTAEFSAKKRGKRSKTMRTPKAQNTRRISL